MLPDKSAKKKQAGPCQQLACVLDHNELLEDTKILVQCRRPCMNILTFTQALLKGQESEHSLRTGAYPRVGQVPLIRKSQHHQMLPLPQIGRVGGMPVFDKMEV